MSRSGLHTLVTQLEQDERELLYIVLKNIQTLALLKRESEWLSTHNFGEHDGSDTCHSHYSHETNNVHNDTLRNMVIQLFTPG